MSWRDHLWVVKLGNIELEHPIMNAAGVNCKTEDEIKELTKTPVSAIVTGSFTKEPRNLNTGETLHIADDYSYSINRLGVPNCGIDNVDSSQFKYISPKPFIISVIVDVDDCEYVIDKCMTFNPDLIELNFSCPNLDDYFPDYDSMVCIMNKVMHGDRYKQFLVKLGPTSGLGYWPTLYDYIAGMVVCNTMPMTWGGGIAGGMGGRALKPISLGMVQRLQEFASSEVSIIGVGGVYTGQDVQEYLDAGANAVQIATAHAIWGPKIFDRVLTEWISLQ